MFLTTIDNLEKTIARQNILSIEFGLNNNTYDEMFYQIIDNLIQISFGSGISELISFYIYERRNLDGSLNTLSDENGKQIPLNNSEDLWNLMVKINPNLENNNTK